MDGWTRRRDKSGGPGLAVKRQQAGRRGRGGQAATAMARRARRKSKRRQKADPPARPRARPLAFIPVASPSPSVARLAGWLALLDSALVRSLSLARCVGCVAWAPVATEHPFLTTIPHPHTPAPSSSPSYSPPPVSSPSHLFPPFSSLSLTKHIPLAGQVFSIPLDPRL